LVVPLADPSTPAGAAAKWRWAFGDGGTSMVQQPVYTYTLPGVYTVTQWITDTASGATDVLTRSGYITVADQGAVAVTRAPFIRIRAPANDR